jgi:uncharacterized protein YbjT (DUF2867 family)
MPPSTVIVFGATSAGGLELCRRLRGDQVRVVAGVRAGSNRSNLEALGVECREADALEPEQLLNAMRELGEQPTVVSLLGGMPNKNSSAVDSQGNINVIDAATAAEVRRFVLVTSVGCNESYKALVWFPRVIILRHTIREKSKAETYLKNSGLAWTIIRPGRLTSLWRRPTGRGILIEHPLAAGPITRVDLGELVYRAVGSEQAIGKTYTAADQRHAKILGGVAVLPAQVLEV